jgi:hypothetical protein
LASRTIQSAINSHLLRDMFKKSTSALGQQRPLVSLAVYWQLSANSGHSLVTIHP